MSITYPIQLPPSNAQKAKISAVNSVSANQSPFTGSSQVQEWPGEYFLLQVSLPPINDRELANKWVSALISLRGMAGTFLYSDPSYLGPRGIATGTPVSDGDQAAQSKTLTISGFTASRTGILKNGDYLQITGASGIKHIHRVLTDANSDSDGLCTVDIFPRLRELIADDTSVILDNPQGTWMLASNQRDFDVDEAMTYGISFSAREFY
jgi:hypothetical protein